MREAAIARKTAETSISARLALDGAGSANVHTGMPFLDHMLALFARHGFFDLDIEAAGDLEVDCHHTVEDVGLVLGQAIAAACGDRSGIRRYGFFILPMDEARASVALDLSGRPWLSYGVRPPSSAVGGIDTRLFHEFFHALSVRAGMSLHIDVPCGEESHHVFEAVFKAFGRALDMATAIEPRLAGAVPSTKGVLDG